MLASSSQILPRAEALYREGAHAAAAALLAPLAESEPSADVLRVLGLCHLRLGDPGAALEWIARARRLAPDDPWTALHFGLALQAAARPAEAEPFLREAARRLPDDPAPLINLSTNLIALDRAEEAVRAASEACFRAPQMPEAHYAYGQAWLAAGRLQEADVAFSDAVTLAPGFARAWIGVGLVRYRKGLMREARLAMRRALDIEPQNRIAFANLAAFDRVTGADEDAEAVLRAFLESDPQALGVRLLLADLLSDDDRDEEALAVLDIEPPTAPEDRQGWAMQRSALLLNAGRADEAARVLENAGPTPREWLPLKAWRETLLALARGEVGPAREKADELARAVETAGESIDPDHAISTPFALAQFWRRQGERARAFGFWVEGHRRLQRFQPYDAGAFRAFADACIETFDRRRLHGARAATCDETPVFIVGMPRSGTTLAEQILDAHTQAHGAGERGALAERFRRLGAGEESPEAVRRIAALDTVALDEAAQDYLAELRALAPGATRIVDKMPGNFRLLGLVALMLPGAKIIHCVRDPRDVGLSIFSHRFRGHHAYAHDLADLGGYIAEHHRLMAHWKAALPNPILTLDHADWIADFDTTLARVLDHVGLPPDPRCARFYESERRVRTASRYQVRQPINAAGVGRWKAFATELRPLIAALEAGGVALPEG